jgi:hypothetical protein
VTKVGFELQKRNIFGEQHNHKMYEETLEELLVPHLEEKLRKNRKKLVPKRS